MKRILCASFLVCLLFVMAMPLRLKAAEQFPYPLLSVSVNPSNVQLYGDNGTPEGIEQFGRLGALIFVFDNSDILKMIIWTAPTSG